MSAVQTLPIRATPTTTTATGEPTLVRILPITTTPSGPFSTSMPVPSSPSSSSILPSSSTSSTPSLSPSPSPNSSSSALPGLKRGIGIGVGVCMFLIIFLLVAFLAYRHRKKIKQAASSSHSTLDPETGLLKSSPISPINEKHNQIAAFTLTEPDSTPVHEMSGQRGEDEGVRELMGRERCVSELVGDVGKELLVERVHELDATEAEIRRVSEEEERRDRRSGNGDTDGNANRNVNGEGDTEWKEVYLNFGR